MKWDGIRGLLLLALLLFSFSSLLFSDVTLTDQEYEIILSELEKSETALTEQDNQITKLQSILKHSETIIKMLKDEQKISSEIISLLKVESDLQLISLKRQRNVQIIHDLKIFGLGILTGGLIGFPAGIRIGVSLQQ